MELHAFCQALVIGHCIRGSNNSESTKPESSGDKHERSDVGKHGHQMREKQMRAVPCPGEASFEKLP